MSVSSLCFTAQQTSGQEGAASTPPRPGPSRQRFSPYGRRTSVSQGAAGCSHWPSPRIGPPAAVVGVGGTDTQTDNANSSTTTHSHADSSLEYMTPSDSQHAHMDTHTDTSLDFFSAPEASPLPEDEARPSTSCRDRSPGQQPRRVSSPATPTVLRPSQEHREVFFSMLRKLEGNGRKGVEDGEERGDVDVGGREVEGRGVVDVGQGVVDVGQDGEVRGVIDVGGDGQGLGHLPPPVRVERPVRRSSRVRRTPDYFQAGLLTPGRGEEQPVRRSPRVRRSPDRYTSIDFRTESYLRGLEANRRRKARR